MASRYSSVTRSLMAAARSSTSLSGTIPRPLHSLSSSFRSQSRRFSFSTFRSRAELGCVPSFLPLRSVVAARPLTSHVSVSVRACCELSQEPG